MGDRRAGRLLAPDQGGVVDNEAEAVATDCGIDGAGASAEEAAVHVVDEGEDAADAEWEDEAEGR